MTAVLNPPHELPVAQKRRNRDTKRRTADLVAEILEQAGAEVVFGLPGGPIAPVFDALLERPAIRAVTVRHDGNAVFAAAGHAQVTGHLGVAIVTSGPGILNCMNGIASANADGLPVLILCGEAPRKRFGKGAIQEGSNYGLNVVAMTSQITKLALEVPEASAVPGLLKRAIATALSGRRGAVVVSLPLDVLGQLISCPTVAQSSIEMRFTIPEPSLMKAAKALNAADRKLIFVGSGARHGRTPELIRAVAEKLQAPVVTTPKAKGTFPEDHPLSLGVFGMGGHPSAKAYVRDGIDTVMVIGSSLNELATDGWSPELGAKRCLIHVDIDAAQLGRAYATDVPIVAPAEQFLDELEPRLRFAGRARRFGVQEAPATPPLRKTEGTTSPITVLRELQEVMPADTIYTVDSGNNLFFALHYLRLNRPDSFVAMFGLVSMGVSLPAAIGAQLAKPARRVVAVTGDGGFLMCASELSVAAQEKLPLVVLVLNDGRYNMIEHGNQNIYGRTAEYLTTPCDLPKLAAGLGAQCVVIDRPGQLAALDLSQLDGPLVIDARIDPEIRLPPNGRFDMIGSNLTTLRN